MSRVSRQLALRVGLRASQRCEYCHLHSDHTNDEFQADHIIPVKHDGPTLFENLAWACFWCNSYKGANISGFDPKTGVMTRLFNPRSDRWLQHFRRDGPRITGTIPVGRTTVRVLNMNEARAVISRALLLQSISFDDRDHEYE